MGPNAASAPRPTAPSCWLCGSPARICYTECEDLEYFVRAETPFARCTRCDFLFMHPAPSQQELEALYPATYHNFQTPTSRLSGWLFRRYHAHQAATCLRHLPPGGRFLEIGCGTGDLLLQLRAHGMHVRGLDISAAACAAARARGLDVFHGPLDAFACDQRFDMVFMSHVIEHVPDPVGTIARVASLLAPGGVLYVETPNVGALDARVFKARWGLVHYPRHLCLFERSTLRRLLEGGGFTVERMGSEINSCGWALSIQGALRHAGWDRARTPRSRYYPLLLLGCLPLNLIDLCAGGTAFLSVVARRAR